MFHLAGPAEPCSSWMAPGVSHSHTREPAQVTCRACLARFAGPLEVYVWEGRGVLEGTYGCGLIVAVAASPEEARQAARAAYGTDVGPGELERSLSLEPQVVRLAGPRAWLVAGGGVTGRG